MKIGELILAIGNRLPASVTPHLRSDAPVTRAIRPLVDRLVPSKPVEVTVRSGPAQGIQLLIMPKSEKYYWTGTHEPHVQASLADILQPGMTFWDVGSHIGFFSLLASRIVGPSGHVHAFEPMNETRKRLEAGVALNDVSNVDIHAVALSDSDGSAVLHTGRSSLTWSLIGEVGRPDGQDVATRTLDSMAKISVPPNLIKVDAEGAELEVLKGGRRLLSQHHPLLIVEFSNDELVEIAKVDFPNYDFTLLGHRHWLMR